MILTDEMKKEYLTLWETCVIKADRVSNISWYGTRILKNISSYKEVEAKTKVPWFIVAVIHALECGLDFSTHLHNGDPLSARTVHVPAGRPVNGVPPFSWIESAIDALGYDGASNVKVWDIPNSLFFLEMYNGSGYRTGDGRRTTPPMRSPYLWSFTNHYERGKYIKDGVFDQNVSSSQAGCCAILQYLMLHDASVHDTITKEPETPIATTKPASWIEEFRAGDGRILVAWNADGGKVEQSHTTKLISEIVAFYGRHPNAKTALVAPESKTIDQSLPKPLGFTMGKAVDIAKREAAQDISWRGNGLAKRYTKKFEGVFGTGRFSWCAAFVTWCCEQAGLNIPVNVPGDRDGYTFALCEAWQQWSIRNGFWVSGVSGMRHGDIVLFDWEGAETPDRDYEDHIGFCVKAGLTECECVEGNVDDAVAVKTRSHKWIQGYIRIPDNYKF